MTPEILQTETVRFIQLLNGMKVLSVAKIIEQQLSASPSFAATAVTIGTSLFVDARRHSELAAFAATASRILDDSGEKFVRSEGNGEDGEDAILSHLEQLPSILAGYMASSLAVNHPEFLGILIALHRTRTQLLPGASDIEVDFYNRSLRVLRKAQADQAVFASISPSAASGDVNRERSAATGDLDHSVRLARSWGSQEGGSKGTP